MRIHKYLAFASAKHSQPNFVLIIFKYSFSVFCQLLNLHQNNQDIFQWSCSHRMCVTSVFSFNLFGTWAQSLPKMQCHLVT